MNHKKPTPMLQERGRKLCPVCGKPSYSLEGIHPQCAVQQADAPRSERMKAEKKQQAGVKKAPLRKSWSKECPQCGTQVHVRQKACTCGYTFGVS
jgi:predicted RNA-binding Zn-ribbon protein involved in translation (DUF1610 family)